MEPIESATGRIVRAGPSRPSTSVATRSPVTSVRFTDTPWGSLRAEHGWSLRDMAEQTGINAGELSRIERGRSCVTPDQARRILAAFDEGAPR